MFFLGTAVAVILTTSQIWVGADSHTIAVGSSVIEGPPECKIRHVGRLYYAYAGLIRDESGRFDVNALIERAAASAHSPAVAASAFQDAVTVPLTRLVEDVRHSNPEYFEGQIRGKRVLEVCFFGHSKGGRPAMSQRTFIAELDAHREVHISPHQLECPGDCPTGMAWAFLGQSTRMNAYLDEHPGFLKSVGFKKALTTLISQEAVANPHLVGGAVDILRLEPHRFQWIERKSECPK